MRLKIVGLLDFFFHFSTFEEKINIIIIMIITVAGITGHGTCLIFWSKKKRYNLYTSIGNNIQSNSLKLQFILFLGPSDEKILNWFDTIFWVDSFLGFFPRKIMKNNLTSLCDVVITSNNNVTLIHFFPDPQNKCMIELCQKITFTLNKW